MKVVKKVKLAKMNSHTKILQALSTGPKKGTELSKLICKSFATRVVELNEVLMADKNQLFYVKTPGKGNRNGFFQLDVKPGFKLVP